MTWIACFMSSPGLAHNLYFQLHVEQQLPKNVTRSYSRWDFSWVCVSIEIKKAHSSQESVQLHHLFTDLESFETAFNSHKNIVKTSLASNVLEELKETLVKLQSEASFLRGKSEDKASNAMDNFAMSLIKIGRYLDGFPRFVHE